MSLTPQTRFVQFLHPGAEHRPAGTSMPWARREHGRKFMRAPGRYVEDGIVSHGSLVFWGEWEPPSNVIDRFPATHPELPRWLHEPVWERPRHRLGALNTDPLVFGERFLYSNCRQTHVGVLQRLAPGSMILFGSKIHHRFVLDTLFVVAELGERYMRTQATTIAGDDWVRAVVFEPMQSPDRRADEAFTLYRGRMYDEAPTGPYSFVPCLPMRDDMRTFARPVIDLDRRWLTPTLARGAKTTVASASELRDLWAEVVAQVVDRSGLALGIELAPPPSRVPDG